MVKGVCMAEVGMCGRRWPLQRTVRILLECILVIRHFRETIISYDKKRKSEKEKLKIIALYVCYITDYFLFQCPMKESLKIYWKVVATTNKPTLRAVNNKLRL